jgi:hypothetical protein
VGVSGQGPQDANLRYHKNKPFYCFVKPQKREKTVFFLDFLKEFAGFYADRGRRIGRIFISPHPFFACSGQQQAVQVILGIFDDACAGMLWSEQKMIQPRALRQKEAPDREDQGLEIKLMR